MDTTAPADARHVPVLRDRIVALLAPALSEPGALFVDATLGMGGHTEAILTACPGARALGIDRDPQALALAGARLARFGDRFRSVHAVYDELAEVLAGERAHAILFDLGVSSLQLDEADRGFAYAQDAPLDMRMDPTTGPTAADLLATVSMADLRHILREYGEERYAGRVARAIVEARAAAPITTSAQLVEIVRRAVPAASQRTGGHPAKRTFQALRIEVNRELAAWEHALPQALAALTVGGRLAVLAYHSLEDRLVKRALVSVTTSSAPPGLPVELPEHAPTFRLLTRGAETPDAAEQHDNPRSASAKLRAAERVRTSKGDRR